jgi:hypothetical protein
MKHAEARGPKTGYDGDTKQAYREAVWADMLKIASDRLMTDPAAVLVVMPSSGTEEIDTLVSMGVDPADIFAIDQSAAVIATSKWRKKYPGVRFAACKVSEAPAILKKRGLVAVAANLDLCCNFSDELVSEVDAFVAGHMSVDDFCFSVTVTKGREGKAINSLLSLHGSDDRLPDKRIAALVAVSQWAGKQGHGIGHAWQIRAGGAYRAYSCPMAWQVFRRVTISEDLFNHHMAEAFDLERQMCEADENRGLTEAEWDGRAKCMSDRKPYAKFNEIEQKRITARNDFVRETYPKMNAAIEAGHKAIDKAKGVRPGFADVINPNSLCHGLMCNASRRQHKFDAPMTRRS